MKFGKREVGILLALVVIGAKLLFGIDVPVIDGVLGL